MRIVCISDTHGFHLDMSYPLPDGDVLIHAGDISNRGQEHNISSFVNWFQNIEGFDTKIFIAGNHDYCFESKPSWLNNYINEENLSQSDCVYLEDSEVILNYPEFTRPLKIYGSPWQPRFLNWAFNEDRDKIHKYWDKIPNDTDVLITHGPPEGIRDYIIDKGIVVGKGCASLRVRVEQVNPCLHVFGHLHLAYGAAVVRDTMFVNASICQDNNFPVRKPIIIDINEVDGIFIADYVEY